MVRKPGKKTFCIGCAFLFYVKTRRVPLCLVSAQFVNGPLRPRIDVTRIAPAEKRNVNNECKFRAIISLRSRRIKRWLLWRMNYGNKDSKKFVSTRIEEYPVSKEQARKEQFEQEFEKKDYEYLSEESNTKNEESSEVSDQTGEKEGS